MDEIEKRLRDTSDNCFTAYETWQKDKKNGDAREALQETIHEMRKVTSRLEIEIAISEREQMSQKPIPIPPHRASGKRGGNNDQGAMEFDDNQGSKGSRGKGGSGQGGRKRRPSGGSGPKKAASGNE